MHVVKLFAVVATGLLVAGTAAAGPIILAQADAAVAQSDPGSATPKAKPKRKSRSTKSSDPSATTTAPADAGAAAAPATGSKKKGKKGKKGKKAEPAPSTDLTPPGPPQTVPTPPPAPAAAPAPAAPEAQTGPEDNDPPSITHTPLTRAMKGKSLTFTARITDPSGVFQPVVYLRKRGLGTGDYIPIKMVGSKLAQGDYIAEVPPALVSADLEYYIEAFDNAGNGPARAGGPENPLAIKIEEEKRVIINTPKPPAPEPVPVAPTVTVQHKGAPPAISHTAVTRATKGQNIEINARLIGDTGVSLASVFFRKSGEVAYRSLPMGDIGGDNWTSTIPAAMATGDLEYYIEASDKYGNGPGRSGAPSLPYRIEVLDLVHSAPGGVVIGRTTGGQSDQPRLVKAPFKPNPGRAVAWLFMGGFVGAGVFAGGESLGAWQTNNEYTHTFQYEGRDVPDLLGRANAYGRRAKTAAIISGASLVVGIVLLIIFPEHPETLVVGGSGGDAPGTVRF